MISKRLFLILGGTVGGLGAVVSITPPQFGSSGGLTALGNKSTTPAPIAPATPTQSAATPVTPTQPTPTTATKKKKSTKKAAAVPAATTPATPTQPPAAPQSAGTGGTFTGSAAQTIYGPVQVQVTVSNGKITQVSVPVYPRSSFRDQSINSQAIPMLIQEVMQAQSANIQGVGGASYTSQGFYDSLVSALKKAGI
jgi:uncharacterized protein with FMN-binding domain